MTILDLVEDLIRMTVAHGNLEVKIESLPIKRVGLVRAIPGEHNQYIDLESIDDIDY